jgi:nuclear pore complex protein Nup188
MSRNPDSTYFPALDACLSGTETLIPWTTAYTGLSDLSSARNSSTLESFVSDDESRDTLARPFAPFQQANAQTKSLFDAKTAPINVSQPPNNYYNLQQLKDDSLWISKELGIDELSALRCAVVEWQQRPSDLLLGKVQSKSSAPDFTQSYFGQSKGAPTDSESKAGPDFEDTELRRQRLIKICLEEKSAAIACSALLISLAASAGDKHGSALLQKPRNHSTWIDAQASRVYETAAGEAIKMSSCIQAVTSLATTLEGSEHQPNALRDCPELTVAYYDAVVSDLVNTLRLILAQVFALDSTVSPVDAISWFNLMQSFGFFVDLSPISSAQNVLIPILQCLVSITSAAILNLPQTMKDIEKKRNVAGTPLYPDLSSGSYITDDACVKELNLILFQAADRGNKIAGPAIYAWSMITMIIRDHARIDANHDNRDEDASERETGRRPSAMRSQTRDQSATEKTWRVIQDVELGNYQDDPTQFFALVATDFMQVYTIVANLSNSLSSAFASDADVTTALIGRLVLFEIVRISLPLVQYGEEVLEALLALLAPNNPTRNSTDLSDSLCECALSDGERFRPHILDQALARYPYELSPLLRILTALATVRTDEMAEIVYLMDELKSFTVQVPEHFRSYALDHEDEGTNSMHLTEDFSILDSRPSLNHFQSQEDSRALVLADGGASNAISTIPAGTSGIIISDTKPFVLMLQHEHSGLAYLGVLLSTLLPNSELVTPTSKAHLDRYTASEIVALITVLVKGATTREESDHILGRFGFSLRDGTDIVTILSDIMELELLAFIDQDAQEGSLQLLVACTDFFDTLLAHTPERTWSWLSRSSLLGINAGVSALVAVVSGVEVQAGQYGFLSSCVKLYESILDNAIYGIVRRKPKTDALHPRRRFDSPMETAEQTPERTISVVLSAYTRIAQDVLLNLNEWGFGIIEEKALVVTRLCNAFSRLLTAAYGIDSGIDQGSKLTEVLSAAAMAQTVSDFVLAPLSTVLAQGIEANEGSLVSFQKSMVEAQTVSVCQYLTTVIRTLKLRSQTAGSLPTQLVKLSPMLATLFAARQAYEGPLAALLAELLLPGPADNTEIPSILGQLSHEESKNFLAVLSQLDRPLTDMKTECTIWNFLAAVLDSNQQYFAMYLLTRSLPKDQYKSGDQPGSGRTILIYALDQLANIQSLSPQRAIAMLQFVAKAQQVWIWATDEVRTKSDFLKNALAWLNDLKPISRSGNMTEAKNAIPEVQMAALVCDVLAANLHASLEIGDRSQVQSIVPHLSFVSEHAMKVDGYNNSLHTNFARNLPKHLSCAPSDFRRTQANPAPLGEDYFYDIDLAKKMLAHDTHWPGRQGFHEEFCRANINLSLVEAQTRLLTSWKTLATTLMECVEYESSLQPVIIATARNALEANSNTNLDMPYAVGLLQTRADLAFVLISRLVDIKSKADQVTELLPLAWHLVKTCPVNYDVARAPEDLKYYTTLLQILYLALQPHAYLDPEPLATGMGTKVILHPSTGEILIDIIRRTIAPGFRALCGNLHTSNELAQAGDFLLLSSLSRAILSVRGVHQIHAQIAEVIAGSSLIRGALSLFSWSDQLAERTEQDPVYATIAVNFLVSLSSVPQIAEFMAHEGALSQLSTANLSNYFRKEGGKGPFDEPQRMFVIWTDGFLPLCLNLLNAVGPAIAIEVSGFLNSFSEQLARAERSLVNAKPSTRNPRAGAVTLGAVSEARSLILISLITQASVSIGAAEGIAGADVQELSIVITGADGQQETRKMNIQALRDDVESLTKNERSLRDRIVPATERELILQASNGNVGGHDEGLQAAIVDVLNSIGQLG